MNLIRRYHTLEEIMSAIKSELHLFLQGLLTDKIFLLMSLSTTSLIQVFVSQWDITLLLFGGTALAFAIMTAFGVIKHRRNGEWNPNILLEKTIIQFVTMVGVILLGYSASLFLFAITKIIALLGIISGDVKPAASLYFAFLGYGVMYTYYFVKTCDLLDQTFPEVLPSWWSAPFRRFRKTGQFRDLLDNSNPEQV